MRQVLLAVFILWSGSVSAAQYKCGDEWVDYWPCDAKDKQAQVVEKNNTQSNQFISDGTPDVRLATVAAELESVQIDARKCDWDLKVNTGGTGCLDFISKIGPGSRNSQSLDELTRLASEESFYKANEMEFQRLYNIQLEIVKVVKLFNARNR